MSRGELLAQAMQRRDAAAYGAVIDGVAHPTWDEIGSPGRRDYLDDARFAIRALDVIDQNHNDADDELEAKAIARAAEPDITDDRD